MEANVEKNMFERNCKGLIKGDKIREKPKKFPKEWENQGEGVMDTKNV